MADCMGVLHVPAGSFFSAAASPFNSFVNTMCLTKRGCAITGGTHSREWAGGGGGLALGRRPQRPPDIQIFHPEKGNAAW